MKWTSISLFLLLSAGLAGCAGASEEPKIATAASAPAAASAAAATTAAGDEVAAYLASARDYARCMRDAGFNVSDPDEKGQVKTLGEPKAGADPRAGREKCSKLLQPIPAELQQGTERTAEQIAAAREYAKCMRANGAADFPDPDAKGEFPDSADGKPAWNQETAAARKAVQKCAPIVGGSGDTSGGVG
ncbi:hypothetical protein J5X75_41130 [Actinoplanes sp. NEAU-H7]|uniref:Lipoprotein n=2 Tax=Actinoplanes flavus TaxID=2820290 RepID=A0ABS3UZA2_9ACTN|nr:hypothetical protein [Actinoplanes flavus]